MGFLNYWSDSKTASRTRQTAKRTKDIARTAQQSLATQQASATDTLGMLRAIWTEQIETNRLLAQIADRLQDRVP